ncbi:MAG TPA: hypothetical protein VL326_04800 [Kofleriaceae bacterium]|nr:hypothetical protein [Kofleriaceae bacterium]
MRTISIAAILLGVAAPANAQPKLPRAEDKAEADRLFEEGRTLLESGDRAQACEKFDLSFRKDPRAVGTMLNLGLCREEAGLVASAVRFYQEARDRAHDQNLPEHQQAAERKIALLAPRVPHLAIALAKGTTGARVLVDDLVIAPDQLADVQVDPGDHAIVVTAPDKLPYEAKLSLKDGEHREVNVPALAGAKTIVVSDGSNRRFFGKVGIGVGAGLLAGSLGLGLYARYLYWKQFPDGARDGTVVRDASHDCWTQLENGVVVRRCNEVGSRALDSARLVGHFSTGAGIAGGVLAIGGVILWATAPRSEPSPVALDVTPQSATVTVTARF